MESVLVLFSIGMNSAEMWMNEALEKRVSVLGFERFRWVNHWVNVVG